MNAREVVEAMVRTGRGDMTVWSPTEVRYALDAHRAEAVGEAADVLTQAFLEETDPVRADAFIEALIRVRRILPCTCARSVGLHEKACQRYVPGHELISPAMRIFCARAELSADQPVP